MKLRSLFPALAALLCAAAGSAADQSKPDQKPEERFEARLYSSPRGGSLPYRLFVPHPLDPKKHYPLVLFLHGAGERGSDNARQLRDILSWSDPKQQAEHPCFILAPQCPNWKEIFQVYGYNTDLAITGYRNYSGSEARWKHYRIHPGERYTGRMKSLVFINDDWGKDTKIESLFRNVKVYEANRPGSAATIDFRKETLTPYSGGGRGNNPAIEEDGAALHMVGDTRKKIVMPYRVTAQTVLEFDFKSGAQGNVHGIGFDDDDQITDYRWVQVDWGAESHTIPKEPSEPLRMVMELLPALQKSFPAMDERRIYAVGLSMGGYGVWDLAARRPDWLAAAAPICGGADTETAATVGPVPVWAFHGGDDTTVPPMRSRYMIAALANVGATPHYKEYPGVGHDSWTRALQEPEMIDWLFRQIAALDPPQPPRALTADTTDGSQIDLKWLAPAANSTGSIKEYRVFRDGSEIGTTPDTHYTDTEYTIGEPHNYSVAAVSSRWKRSKPTAVVWAKPASAIPPRLISAEAFSGTVCIEARFSIPPDRKSAIDASNYSLDREARVISAELIGDERTVRLKTTQMEPGESYTLTARNIQARDIKSPSVDTPSSVTFQPDPTLAIYWRLDEGEGATAGDDCTSGLSAIGHPLNLVNVDWTRGRWGKALHFEGIQNRYAFSRIWPLIRLNGGWTLSLWIKKGGSLFDHQALFSLYNLDNSQTTALMDLDPSHRIRVAMRGPDNEIRALVGGRIDALDWHHLVLTRDNRGFALYIDGAPQGEQTAGAAGKTLGGAITIGSAAQGLYPMQGDIDDVRFYTRALTREQIMALARSGGH